MPISERSSEAKWAQNDKLHYTVDYQKLKSLLYKPVKPQS